MRTFVFIPLLIALGACSAPPQRVAVESKQGSRGEGPQIAKPGNQPPQQPAPGENPPNPTVTTPPTSQPPSSQPPIPSSPPVQMPPKNMPPVNQAPQMPPQVTPMPPPVTPMPPQMPPPQMPPASNTGDCGGTPAINNIHKWWATTEGQMTPNSGTLVKKENGMSVARVTWIGQEWHVNPVWLGNKYDYGADLSKAKTFTLSYQAPGDFYVQMRPAFQWSGGQQWGAKFEKSPDKITTVTIPFDDKTWIQVPGLDKPTWSVAKAQADVRGFVIVGKTPGVYVWTAMIIDGFSPPCN